MQSLKRLFVLKIEKEIIFQSRLIPCSKCFDKTKKKKSKEIKLQILQNTKYKIQNTKNTKYKIQNTKYKIQNTKYKIQNTKYKIQNTKYKIQNTKYKIQNTKYKIQNTKYKIQNTISEMRDLDLLTNIFKKIVQGIIL